MCTRLGNSHTDPMPVASLGLVKSIVTSDSAAGALLPPASPSVLKQRSQPTANWKVCGAPQTCARMLWNLQADVVPGLRVWKIADLEEGDGHPFPDAGGRRR